MRRQSLDIPTDVFQFHAEMLNDKTRTANYLDAVRNVVRPGDVVVDIGTGTGILAIAAARAGASHVYAIEAGRIGETARRLIAANGLADRITLLRGWSTQIWLPERADVVISEVIGNEPLDEGVIGITRDALRRLAKPGARLVPSRVRILGLPVTIPDEELDKLTLTTQTLQNWHSWYDITFDPLAEVAQSSRFSSFFGYFINPYRMRTWEPLSDPVPLADIEFTPWTSPWISTTRIVTAKTNGQLTGLVAYFELYAGPTPFLSTHPMAVDERNHWLSPVRVFTKPMALRPDDRFEITYWRRPLVGLSRCEVHPVEASDR
jgi:type I protein arginine methyltransferase